MLLQQLKTMEFVETKLNHYNINTIDKTILIFATCLKNEISQSY